jgi:transcription antitermination factor NusG
VPLLPAEPCFYPEGLLTDPDPGVDAKWWVLHTRPRTEKALARGLLRAAVPFFLPTYERTWRSKGRLQTAHLPLFTGYLFLRAGEEGRVRALETNYVAHCIPVADQQKLRGELERVFRLMASDLPIGPEAQLQPGATVRITRGPLAGLDGTILRRAGKLTLVVEVQLLRQGVAVEIESWMVDPVPKADLAAAR